MKISCCPGCLAPLGSSFGKGAEVVTVNGDETFVQPAYEVVGCPRCGLLYKTTFLDAADLDRYYRKTDFTKWETKGFYPTERATLKILRQLPAGAAVLDFGCSSGRLLAALGPAYHRFGIEPNAQAANTAAAKGIKILQSPEDETFDAIVLADVFEHLYAPTEMLERLLARLKPNGWLILSTGDGDSAPARQDLANYWYLRNVEHLIMLTRQYSGWFAEKNGLQIRRWLQMSHYDASLSNRIWQTARWQAYLAFHGRTRPALYPLIRIMPVLSKARHWTLPPLYTCGRDHVVAAMQKVS
jgi:SAM-dependent methyltransferase